MSALFGRSTCPVCAGPIAHWAVRPSFTCHHCRWALASNRNAAIGWALLAFAAVEAALLGGLWYFTGSFLRASGAWLAGGGLLGAGAGYAAFRLALSLQPLRPQRTREA